MEYYKVHYTIISCKWLASQSANILILLTSQLKSSALPEVTSPDINDRFQTCNIQITSTTPQPQNHPALPKYR
jgi:predicted secreted protein